MDDVIMESGLEVERQWKDYLGLTAFSDLNRQMERGNLPEIIQVCEAMHDRRMVEIASCIRKSGKRLILLAGPSSSGKTTCAKKLCVQMRAEGLKPVYLGIDDYYKDRDEIPVGPDGLRDFESVSAIDVDLFSSQMEDLLGGRTVDVPEFDFTEGKKVFGKRSVHVSGGQPIVIEGILALKEELGAQLPEEQKYRIYVCPLSSLKQNDGSKVKKTDIRKLRRLVRDHARRNYSLDETFELWPKVRAGEDDNIFPYSGRADQIFNSSQPYELAAIKKYAMPLLCGVEPQSRFFQEAARLKKLLDQVDVMEDTSRIEGDSIIREFIGGGEF